jgi:hypothetical protein
MMNERTYDEQNTGAMGNPMTAQPPGEQQLSTADMAGMGTQQPTQQPQDALASDERARDRRKPTGTERTDTGSTRGQVSEEQAGPLLDEAESREMRSRWDKIQTGFVDEPRQAVERADQLVAGAMKRLAETFANERSTLENQWSKGDQVSTEDLRVALRRYRTFFDRLLSI